MIYNSDTSDILNKLDEIIDCIMNLNETDNYITNKVIINSSSDVLSLTEMFNEKKKNFDKIKSYGKHTPGYSTIQKELYASKRQLDLNESVEKFRISEMDLQLILDEICEIIAKSFSPEVIVSSGTVFSKNERCGGNCHY